jgi:protein ImuB
MTTSCTPNWLALYLPGLPLQALYQSSSPAGDQPIAIHEAKRGRRRLIACNRNAQQQGLHPGMGLEAARALCPTLTAAPRDPDREQALLERLAAWAGFASPRVSLNPGTGLSKTEAGLAPCPHTPNA